MPINPFFPATYAGGYPYMLQNQMQTQTVQQPGGGIIWVQGIEGAKSHPVGAGQAVQLMDSESPCFFIKSADQSGMPLPLRVFDYTERTAAPPKAEPQPVDVSGFVTRDEFESRMAQIMARYSQQQPFTIDAGGVRDADGAV